MSESPGRRLEPIHGAKVETPSGAPILETLTKPDLATKVGDLVDTIVDTVRNKVVNPIERAAIYIVLALFSAFAGLTLVVLLLVGLFRILVGLLNLLPGAPYVWLAYLIMGGSFLALGLFLMYKRSGIKADPDPVDAPPSKK